MQTRVARNKGVSIRDGTREDDDHGGAHNASHKRSKVKTQTRRVISNCVHRLAKTKIHKPEPQSTKNDSKDNASQMPRELTPRSPVRSKPKSEHSRSTRTGPRLGTSLKLLLGSSECERGGSAREKLRRGRTRGVGHGSAKARSQSVAPAVVSRREMSSIAREGEKSWHRIRTAGSSWEIDFVRSISERHESERFAERFGSGRYDGKASIAKSPRLTQYGDEMTISNWETAMGLPEESTMEEIFHITSDSSASEQTDMISVQGIFSSLIAIENDL